jgi:hypothetical protein
MAYRTIPSGGGGLWTTTDDGTDYTATLSNPTNSAGADAIIKAEVGGTSAGDAVFQAGISGGQYYSWGVDNSVATDPFVMSAGTALGTNNFLSASTTTTTGLTLRNPGTAGPALLSLNDTSGAGLGWSTNTLTVGGTKTFLLAGAVQPQEWVHSSNNIGLFAIGSYGSGSGVVFVGNRTTAPTADPTGGGILYAASGDPFWRRSSGGTHRPDLKGADVASGTTVTLGTDGNSFDITGTTTIDYITTTNWAVGARVVLQFDGSVTVRHNIGSVPANTAAIFLAGAANFAATANDTLSLWYDGTVWREIARTVI